MRRTTVLLVALCAATFLSGLGRPAIGDSDEAFYAEAGREMLASGDWLTPRYNYEDRFQKPILFYWLVAGTYAALGVGETAARLWAALAGLGLTLLTAACGRVWYGERTARLAGSIVATSFGYFSIGRLSLPDLPLAFFITLSIWATIRGVIDPGSRPFAWLITAGFAIGLGFLTKGPIAVVVPAMVILPIWWLERSRAKLSKSGLMAGVIAAVLIGAPWYVAMAQVHGTPYLKGFFVGDNVDRFATTRFNEPRPAWFYVPIVAGGMLPWTPFFLSGVSSLTRWIRTRRRPEPTTVRLLLWAVLPLLFFTASIGKQPRYVLPILPPLALLLARVVEERLAGRASARHRRDRLLQVVTLSVGALLVALGLLIFRAMPLVVMVDARLVAAGATLVLLSGIGVIVAACVTTCHRFPSIVAFAGAIALIGLQYGLSPAGRDPVQDMASLVLRHRQHEEPVATFRVFVRNLVFYTHAKQDDLPSDGHVKGFLRQSRRVLCVISADELARITASEPLPVRTLGEVLYFNASAVKLRTLLSPDPSRDLERVVLVTNQ